MYKDNSFYSTKFSTDRGYATSLDMNIYLRKEDIEEWALVMTAEYRPVEYGKDYDVVNNPDKFEPPYFYEGKYYANIDGEMIEITKEVAYAMNNFYRSSKAKKVEIKNELGEVVDKMLREVPYSGQSIDGEVCNW